MIATSAFSIWEELREGLGEELSLERRCPTFLQFLRFFGLFRRNPEEEKIVTEG